MTERVRYPEGNSFINVRTKIRNKHLSSGTAWQEAQPLFLNRIHTLNNPEEALGIYRKYSGFLREVFDLARKAHIGVNPENNLKAVTTKISKIDIENPKDLVPLIFLVRDVYKIAPPQKGPRSKS